MKSEKIKGVRVQDRGLRDPTTIPPSEFEPMEIGFDFSLNPHPSTLNPGGDV
jgi:hypothetical protein